MSSMSIAVAQLFKAYGKEADELTLRTYMSVLKNFDMELIEKTIHRSVSGHFERMPTVTQLVNLARSIAHEEAQQGRQNLIEHSNLTNDYLKAAIQAGWTLAQRDELIDVCDRAINLRTGEWKWTKRHWSDCVAHLVRNVNAYREACALAKQNGTEMPDEMAQDWAWAIKQDDKEDEWDPAKESLWDCVKRIAEEKHDANFYKG